MENKVVEKRGGSGKKNGGSGGRGLSTLKSHHTGSSGEAGIRKMSSYASHLYFTSVSNKMSLYEIEGNIFGNEKPSQFWCKIYRITV